MGPADFRTAIGAFLRAEAQPPDKFSHQPRLYRLARSLAQGSAYDDDVLYAAAWLHDVGVFTGHRPADVVALATWDHIAYATAMIPRVLRTFGFPADKIEAVNDAVRTHLPSGQPTSFEGTLLRDADILEQLGAIGMLRMLSKVGRDTRYPTHEDAVEVLRRNARSLPAQLQLPMARRIAEHRLSIMKAFFEALDAEQFAPDTG